MSKQRSPRTSASARRSPVVIGIDIGGTKTALLACDAKSGEEIGRERFLTPAEAGPDALIACLREAIERLLDSSRRRPRDLYALGVAVPGPVDADDGRVIVAGNLAGWKDVPLREILRRHYEIPVWIDQDANAAALGERWRGAAKQMSNFVFLALGTGIGAGIVINGRLHRGYHQAAGEIGNFVMSRAHLGNDRGGHGDLEQRIGSPVIRAQAQKATRQRLSAASAISQATTDRRLRPLSRRVVDYLAMAVINLTAVLDPQAIIFGGGTVAAGDDVLERVREHVERELRFVPALMRSVLGEDAQLHGTVFGALWERDPNLALQEELR